MPSKPHFGRKKQRQRLDCYDNLEGSLAYTWDLLERGARDRRSPMHTPTVATVAADGRPSIRTVVLRGCDRTARTLRFHTDRRAAKVQHILHDPRGAVHLYDAIEKIQLRLDVRLEPMAAPDRNTVWAGTHPMSRKCYQVTTRPGEHLAHPTDVTYDAQATDDGAVHFLPIRVHIERIEWLYLAAVGHRRAEFTWTSEGLRSRWLVP